MPNEDVPKKILRQSGYFQGDIELVCCYENCKVEMIYTLEHEVMDELKPTINNHIAYRCVKNIL